VRASEIYYEGQYSGNVEAELDRLDNLVAVLTDRIQQLELSLSTPAAEDTLRKILPA
jgi:hypothetical protein